MKQIGSCNTVVHIQSMWKGINTDYYGFLEPLSSRLTDGTIKSALVIGAGGASRAIVWALRNHDVKVTVVNRTVEHAKALAMETMSAYDSLDHISAYSGSVDLVVQTTSVGMTPHEQDDASKGYLFSGKEIAFDLVYKPRRRYSSAGRRKPVAGRSAGRSCCWNRASCSSKPSPAIITRVLCTPSSEQGEGHRPAILWNGEFHNFSCIVETNIVSLAFSCVRRERISVCGHFRHERQEFFSGGGTKADIPCPFGVVCGDDRLDHSGPSQRIRFLCFHVPAVRKPFVFAPGHGMRCIRTEAAQPAECTSISRSYESSAIHPLWR